MANNLPFGKPLIGGDEIQAASKVLSQGTLVHGSITPEFEEAFADFLGIRNAVAVSSCTAGLHLGLFARGITTGMRVAVPAMTHVATAHAVELLGATPVFIDADPETGNIDPDLLKTEAANGLDAIIPVHYLGLPCDMDQVLSIANDLDAFVLEDCALSLGATYDNKSTGGIGDGGSFSFYPVKHMTSIEGGMFTTNDDDLARLVRKKRAFGYNREVSNRVRPGFYDVDTLGFNYRMSEVEAAVGLRQLARIPGWLEQRKENFKKISEVVSEFPTITVFPDEHPRKKSSHYCFNIVLPRDGSMNRERLQDRFTSLGIGTSIHYPSAVPLFTYYRDKYSYSQGDFPVAEWLAASTISLPVAPHLGPDGAERVALAVRQALDEEINGV